MGTWKAKAENETSVVHIVHCTMYTIVGDFQQQAYCKRGKGLIKVNGRPLELVQLEALSFKLQEPILLLGTSGQGQVC